MNFRPKTYAAFTLLEVMVAVMIFFMCMFSILTLVSSSLSHVRALQQTTVNPGMLAAELSVTNQLSEGVMSGDFGDVYPDFRWSYDAELVGTNLYNVDFVVIRKAGGAVESQLSVRIFSPQSRQGIRR